MRRITAPTLTTNHLVWSAYSVKGASMMPSFRPGDLLLVSPRAYRVSAPARGDPVIVREPGAPWRRYLKRVVGLPGEEVRLSEGTLFLDGRHLAEPYLAGLPASVGLGEGVWGLLENQYFVMGDNRAHSTDSRRFGPVGLEQIAGKARFRWWPLSRWGRVG